jgi:DNA-binding LacI/PurR family transcriptional regulator
MSDVAVEAGATSAEVAMVVAADSRIDSSLRRRIVDAIDALQYEPLAMTRARQGRPLRFGIAMKVYRGEDPEGNRFYTPMASAIARMCAENGAEVIPGQIAVNDDFEPLDLPPVLCRDSCDGTFVLGARFNEGFAARARDAGIPIVLVDGYSADGTFDSVVTDNVSGGKAAVEHLVANGHSAIALLGTEPNCFPSMLERRIGYAEAMEAHGLEPRFIDTPYLLHETAALVGLAYVRRHPEVTAVFGANDLIMITFMKAARGAGLRVPGDLSLVGFDGIDLGSLVMPALTSLAVDVTMMGRAAFALMAHRQEEPAHAPLTSRIVPHLVERESVGPPHSR